MYSAMICNALGIDRLKTTAYRPSANGQIERFNRIWNSLLAKVIADHQRNWSQHLNYVLFSYIKTVKFIRLLVVHRGFL